MGKNRFIAKKTSFNGRDGYKVVQLVDGTKVVEQFIFEECYEEFCEFCLGGIVPEMLEDTKYLSSDYAKVHAYKGYDICTLKVAVPSEGDELGYRIDDERFEGMSFEYVSDAVEAISQTVMTNAERIRRMSNLELAELIVSGEWSSICGFCRYYGTPDCRYDDEDNDVGGKERCIKGALKFLESEVT